MRVTASAPWAVGAARVTALLGPTNTGKTHAAMEQMLTHASGVIGLPLRLLAREVYDRVSARLGEGAVALVTGEEKRVPSRPRYWVCTAEAMPAGLGADFVALDEVQLCGHRERGHVFADRLLHYRGRHETWFMGADTMRPLLAELVPEAQFEARPRLSTLTSAGSLTLGALPPRTAVVAFSTERVYALGERLRARRGGAAVVLGRLSPRARNAQVALYQAGEVDYLVATDAIGMGLNLDVDCVAFSEARKFDGADNRALHDAELAQIAGRAGRHLRDGRFATLAPEPPLGPATVRALEAHRFPPQRQALWRSRDLDFASAAALAASLRRPSPHPALRLAPDAGDLRALDRLMRDAELAPLVADRARVPLLWEVCQIPDFRHQGGLDDVHAHLLEAIFRQLTAARGQLDPDWMEPRVSRLDDETGDLDTLLARLASIRTWTYVAHHARWVADAVHWQERARAIEDRLSDALHARLVLRFVDPGGATRRRSASGANPARTEARAGARAIDRPAGGVGLSLAAKLRAAVGAPEPPSTAAAAARGQRDRRRDDRWIEALVAAPHDHFRTDDEGRILDAAGTALGRLARGADLLHPDVTLALDDDDAGAGARQRVARRLLAYARDLVAALGEPLDPARTAAPQLPPAARGLLYQLEQNLGTVWVGDAAPQLSALDDEALAALGAAGVRVGHHLVFVPPLLRPPMLRLRALLCAAFLRPERAPAVPAPGLVSFAPDPEVPPAIYTTLGFPLFGGRAIRADVAEAAARRLQSHHPTARELASRLACHPDELPLLRRALGPREPTAVGSAQLIRAG